MASIFTFDSAPLKVASPWPTKPAAYNSSDLDEGPPLLAGMEMPPVDSLVNCGTQKLVEEPQEGPIEYKLHLLLRPRRNYVSTSTVRKASGSYLSKSRVPRSQSDTDIMPIAPTALLAPSNQSRQNRLQHLTTQLLWRLQQSSPYHSSSKASLVLPILPNSDVERSALTGPGSLIPGLEESNGALYELGVSDDGTFVGLTRDELEESLAVLRAMAFSLGCNLKVIRVIDVGDCQWTEEGLPKPASGSMLRQEKLLVAEVLVAPGIHSHHVISDTAALPLNRDNSSPFGEQTNTDERYTTGPHCEQLRISLTGSTTSGKSSLLGTLSTSTLDNGRGKSRLSLLKHRHEIVSGVTSSLAQELFGYYEAEVGATVARTKIINYASGNVSSWDDIHNASGQGRLVFVTDSAGHPRYRRTTVRGLVSWAPHWTVCCIAADDQDDSSGKIGATSTSSDVLGSAGLGVDLSKAHLDLCLKLNLPLVIAITKLDLATKTGLRDTLSRVLTTLKAAGRKPAILSSTSNDRSDAQLEYVAKGDEDAARRAIASVPDSELLVPIVLTSAVTGSGFGRLHALLNQLPLVINETGAGRRSTTADIVQPERLFHVDEVFDLPIATNSEIHAASIILSGYLRHGSLEVGDEMVIGPKSSEESHEKETGLDLHRAKSCPGFISGSPRSEDLPAKLEGLTIHPRKSQTWKTVRIASLRNLRLPVRTLLAGQVGTVGITLDRPNDVGSGYPSILDLCIRRGMVLLSVPENNGDWTLPSYTRFSAVFQEASLPAWPGVLVIVYIASIRASAKIIEVKALETYPADDGCFTFDDVVSNGGGTTTPDSPSGNQQTEITFEFTSTQEWFEIGAQVLVTPGGGPSLTGQPEQREIGSAGLDGYVGKIVRAVDC